MPAGNTYEAIATNTLASPASSVVFSSIPSTYTDLVLVVAGGMSTSAYPVLRFNSDSGSNYSGTQFIGYSTSSIYNSRAASATFAYIGGFLNYWPTTNIAVSITNIQNYSNTTTNKTLLTRDSYATTEVGNYINMWRSTSAINAISVFPSAGNFITGTSVSLYGIKAA